MFKNDLKKNKDPLSPIGHPILDASDRMEYVRRAANYINNNKYSFFFVGVTLLLLFFFKTIPGTIHRFNQSVKHQKQAVKTIDSLSVQTIQPYNYNKK
jgi:hypothetical protein